jgi:hypothetical protein
MKRGSKKYKQLSLSVEILKRLEDYAYEQGMWESSVVTKALTEYLDKVCPVQSISN